LLLQEKIPANDQEQNKKVDKAKDNDSETCSTREGTSRDSGTNMDHDQSDADVSLHFLISWQFLWISHNTSRFSLSIINVQYNDWSL